MEFNFEQERKLLVRVLEDTVQKHFVSRQTALGITDGGVEPLMAFDLDISMDWFATNATKILMAQYNAAYEDSIGGEQHA